MVRALRDLQDVRLIDLSLPISPATAEPEPVAIEYVGHREGGQQMAAMATDLLRQTFRNAPEAPVITEDALPDGLGLANENLRLDTHAGTHMDAPWHFGPLCENKPAKTIDQIPLEWCFGPGVVLDLRHKRPGETILTADIKAALESIHYDLKPGDIVLLLTGADKRFHERDYFSAYAGMGREATLWLLEQGIRVIGTDAWGFDRPAGAMLQDYLRTGDRSHLLPAHLTGREHEYCHIEKLANLDQIPTPHGFWVSCFPVKVERGSAGWLRAVALVEGESHATN
jgi:kynurenine formamidase